MDNSQITYAWDRLTRAAVRAAIMTNKQRDSLVFALRSQNPPADIEAACVALLGGTLKAEDAAAKLKAAAAVAPVDINEYRKSLGPAPDQSAAIDAQLGALLRG